MSAGPQHHIHSLSSSLQSSLLSSAVDISTDTHVGRKW